MSKILHHLYNALRTIISDELQEYGEKYATGLIEKVITENQDEIFELQKRFDKDNDGCHTGPRLVYLNAKLISDYSDKLQDAILCVSDEANFYREEFGIRQNQSFSEISDLKKIKVSEVILHDFSKLTRLEDSLYFLSDMLYQNTDDWTEAMIYRD